MMGGMRFGGWIRLAASVGVMAAPNIATAQTSKDVIVMRRTVSVSHVEAAPSRVNADWRLGDPMVSPGCTETSPSMAPVTCRTPGGELLADSFCTKPKPTGAGVAPSYATCTTGWVTGVPSTPPPGCGTTYTPTRTVECQRYGGTSVTKTLDDGACTGPKPSTNAPDVLVISSCTYAPAYSATYGACAGGQQYAPIVSCTRSDKVDVATSFCSPQQTSRACDMPGTWTYGSWGAWSSTCSDTATRTRTATCTYDGVQVADARCTEAKVVTDTQSIRTNCGPIVANGTFETRTVAPWTGSAGLYGGTDGYGAAGSRWVMGVYANSTVTSPVSNMTVGTVYTLSATCHGHNDSAGVATIAVAGRSVRMNCAAYGYPATTMDFTAVAASDTITITQANQFTDFDNISIVAK